MACLSTTGIFVPEGTTQVSPGRVGPGDAFGCEERWDSVGSPLGKVFGPVWAKAMADRRITTACKRIRLLQPEYNTERGRKSRLIVRFGRHFFVRNDGLAGPELRSPAVHDQLGHAVDQQ